MVSMPLIRSSPLIAANLVWRSVDRESIYAYTTGTIDAWADGLSTQRAARFLQTSGRSAWSISIYGRIHHTQFLLVHYHLPPSSPGPTNHQPDESRQSSPIASRQSRAAHTHPVGPARVGVLQPHLLSVLVGWAQLARKLIPATPTIDSLMAPNHRCISQKPTSSFLALAQTSLPQAPQQVAIK